MHRLIEQLDIATPGQRRITGWHALILGVLCVTLSLYVLSINSFLLINLMRRSGAFAALLLAIAFLVFPATARSPHHRPSALDYGLAAAGMAAGFYIYFAYAGFVDRQMRMQPLDIGFALMTMALALEAGRRALGIWMPALAVAFMAYALFGRAFPAPFGHFGVAWQRLLLRMYMVDEGMFGTTFQIAQTYITLFILFGALLTVSGASRTLTDIGLAISGRQVGAPAKVAVLASGFTGMISGTAAANVATTGTVTIPLMKRTGFSSHYAGAVEAMASTGGLITPPIMGAAAFLIADFVGMPYSQVVLAAITPAVLFYASLLFLVHLRARKEGIAGLARDEVPPLGRTLLRGGHLVIPIVALFYLLIAGYTPSWAAIAAMAVTVLVSQASAAGRIGPRRLVRALTTGAIASTAVSIACLVAGFIVGVVSMTGVAQVFTTYIDTLSGGVLLAALAMTAVAAIFMSCALPATAVYIVVAVTVAPALIEMGAEALAAHFFVFWFGVMSNITPPVAIACFTAAGIAGAGPSRIAFTTLRLAVPALAIPFLLVYRTELLLIDASWGSYAATALSTTVAMAAYVIAAEGFWGRHLGWIWRTVFALIALACAVGQTGPVGIAGLVAGVVALGMLWQARPAAPPQPARETGATQPNRRRSP